MRAHFRSLAPFAKGLLVPGSTGDGWDLRPEEIRQVLRIALEEARQLDLALIIGILKPDGPDMLKSLRATADWLKSEGVPLDAANRPALRTTARVCGFTVCPPRGKDVSQAEMDRTLATILETGFPIALYQLPQMTQNEMGAELVASLASRFENFILLKDSSGADRVVLSGKDLGGVFTMRGGEGNYHRWLQLAGGPYDGFLLGSANAFAAPFSEMIQLLQAGKTDAARELSERVTAVVSEVARLTVGLPVGHPFANANKALDHFMAWGPRAAEGPPLSLRGGSPMPIEVLRATSEALVHYRLMPAKGYLE
jgi:dihydrodipicolinate synthase/N-acetylneuraminate lyase